MFADAIKKEYPGFGKTASKLGILLLILLVSGLALSSFYNVFINNDYSKDLNVADFRTDINKLWEVSKIIEARRINNSDLTLSKFGTTGNILLVNEMNPNLENAIISIADSDGNSKLSDNEIQSLGIMKLDRELYSRELSIQFYHLSIDNNLEHYVIITEGQFTGTILYNGGLRFIDSNKRCYLGVELYQQL
jgi:hypothetical protein